METNKLLIKANVVRNLSLSILIASFIVFYFSDGISKVLYRGGADFHRYSRIIKAGFTIFILLYGILTINREKANILMAIGILVVNFLIGQYFLGLKMEDIGFLENMSTLFKYLFPLILFFLVSDILKLDSFPNKIKKTYYSIIGLNSLLILLGLAFGIRVLTTYQGPWRFGYDGLIFAQNEATFVFIFAITIVYYRRFYLDIKEVIFWIILLPSILVATKGIYLFMALLVLFHILLRVSFIKLFGVVFGIAVFLYALLNSFINEILVNSYNVFMHMYKKGGLLFALLSGRDQFINEKMVPLIYDYWSLPNYVFGGQDVIKYYIEMGFFDLFLFFGLFGSIIYLYVFYKIFSIIPFQKKFKLFFGLTLFVIIATAGHFFESGIAGLHFLFMLLIITFSERKRHKEVHSNILLNESK